MFNKHPHPPHIENPKQCFALFEDPVRSPFPLLGEGSAYKNYSQKVNAVAVAEHNGNAFAFTAARSFAALKDDRGGDFCGYRRGELCSPADGQRAPPPT